ncbi:hypothetical protein AYK26_00555 [Euryarchaeota archaeon SM23-78]|nr:MAG: hypothetical protein AYK26_00555 [Euryarchaeota archaeon SM23-78]MBW3001394.1 cytochrome c biogenesis protein [Candidatus Woesearchaeota archaeon]
MKKLLLALMLLCVLLFTTPFAFAEELHDSHADIPVCAVYFTGIGCPHCAKVEPFVKDLLEEYPTLILIRYEIYQQQQNAPLLETYASNYNFQPGIPVIIFNDKTVIQGDSPILRNFKKTINSMESNPCPLIDGSAVNYKELECDTLPGRPEILIGENKSVGGGSCDEIPQELTLAKILGLAAVDAINPCELAVLALMLIAILTYNPRDKKKVLLAGLAFTLAVFVMYIIYGLIIIKFFQLIQLLVGIRLWLYKILGVVAIILGLFNIRDFFRYRPGGFATEMPLFLRPKVKKLIAGVTSPGGAFVVGLLVTLFLIPCTIGPYIIAGGILSALELLKTLPWLLIYNLVFVLPMLIITFIVYLGFTTVENVSGWKDKNIRYLHLVAGIILFLLGLAMILGLV